jgi:hypothetical protein
LSTLIFCNIMDHEGWFSSQRGFQRGSQLLVFVDMWFSRLHVKQNMTKQFFSFSLQPLSQNFYHKLYLVSKNILILFWLSIDNVSLWYYHRCYYYQHSSCKS